jgi:Putative peptidoglycan binding domain
MSQLKIRTRIMTTAAALTLWPALALAGGDSTHSAQTKDNPQGQPRDPSAATSDPSMDRQTQSDFERVQPGDTSSPGVTSQNQNSMPSTPSSTGIDPAEVQKVFGMDVGLLELSSLDTEQVQRLQQTLKERGHYQGAIDGIVGPKTRSALTAMLAEQFALNQRLVNQGKITEQLAASIGLDTEGRTPVSGVDMSGLPQQNQQQRPNVQATPAPANGQRNARPASPAPSVEKAPPDSRTEDGRMDDYAPVTPVK